MSALFRDRIWKVLDTLFLAYVRMQTHKSKNKNVWHEFDMHLYMRLIYIFCSIKKNIRILWENIHWRSWRREFSIFSIQMSILINLCPIVLCNTTVSVVSIHGFGDDCLSCISYTHFVFGHRNTLNFSFKFHLPVFFVYSRSIFHMLRAEQDKKLWTTKNIFKPLFVVQVIESRCNNTYTRIHCFFFCSFDIQIYRSRPETHTQCSYLANAYVWTIRKWVPPIWTLHGQICHHGLWVMAMWWWWLYDQTVYETEDGIAKIHNETAE